MMSVLLNDSEQLFHFDGIALLIADSNLHLKRRRPAWSTAIRLVLALCTCDMFTGPRIQ